MEESSSELSQIADFFKKYDLQISQIIPEKESAEYCACDFKINDFNIKFRKSKITPTKVGQFVTVWKRIENGTIAPFENTDFIDFLIVCSKNDANFGYFIFPKKVLVQQGIFTEIKEGKRAFRVYPPWDIAVNNQAVKTQRWQLEYFYNFGEDSENSKLLSYFDFKK